MGKKSFLVVKVDKCLACKSCEMACAVEHSESKTLIGALSEPTPPRSRLKVAQGASFSVPLQCRQCEDAPCMAICPTNALDRADLDSPVIIEHEKCIGCNWCVLACPFGVISFDAKGRAIIKCDQCFERVQEGGLPACVESCKTHALEFKTADAIIGEKRESYLLKIEQGMGGGEK